MTLIVVRYEATRTGKHQLENVQLTTAAMFPPAVVKQERGLSVLIFNALTQSQTV